MTRRGLFGLGGMVAAARAQRSFGNAKPAGAARSEIVELNRIWGQAPHNAFTDLVRYRERFYCVFREAASHVSGDGAIRVLSSADATRWESAVRITYPAADLRDPKVVVAPGNRLMLTAAAAMPASFDYRHKNLVWFSSEGREWTSPEEIGERNFWLWRVSWHRNRAIGMGYSTVDPRLLRAYSSGDGIQFGTLNENVFDQGYPSETSILFLNDESALCLMRRDRDTKTAQLGRSRPPYRGWTWQDLKTRIGGPHMIRLPDGRFVAAVRLYDGKTRTSLCWLEPSLPALTEFLPLPSNGDSSYAGLVHHNDLLHVSYYSSHEDKTAIYLAKVKLA
jgi:hypothetical protein